MKSWLEVLGGRLLRAVRCAVTRVGTPAELDDILKEYGLAERDGRRKVFVNQGKWCVDIRHYARFLLLYHRFLAVGRPPIRMTVMWVKEDSALAECAWIRYKLSVKKVTLFFPHQRMKIALWKSAKDCQRELRGLRYYAGLAPDVLNGITNPVGDTRSMGQKLVGGGVIKSDVYPTTLVEALIDSHARNLPIIAEAWNDYFAKASEAGQLVLPHLTSEETQLQQRLLMRMREYAGRIPVVPTALAHNDLGSGSGPVARRVEPSRGEYDARESVISPPNVVVDNGKLYVLDYEQCLKANLWYDFVYLYMFWPSVCMRDVLKWVDMSCDRLLVDRCGHDHQLYVDLFIADFMVHLATFIDDAACGHRTRREWYSALLKNYV